MSECKWRPTWKDDSYTDLWDHPIPDCNGRGRVAFDRDDDAADEEEKSERLGEDGHGDERRRID